MRCNKYGSCVHNAGSNYVQTWLPETPPVQNHCFMKKKNAKECWLNNNNNFVENGKKIIFLCYDLNKVSSEHQHASSKYSHSAHSVKSGISASLLLIIYKALILLWLIHIIMHLCSWPKPNQVIKKKKHFCKPQVFYLAKGHHTKRAVAGCVPLLQDGAQTVPPAEKVPQHCWCKASPPQRTSQKLTDATLTQFALSVNTPWGWWVGTTQILDGVKLNNWTLWHPIVTRGGGWGYLKHVCQYLV